MNYETYDKDKHTLEVGTKIRLAGREGEITDIVVVGAEDIFTITWSDTRSTSRLNIYRFPNLEVMDKPLTIDKRVKEDIFSLIESITVDIAVKCGGDTWESVDELNRYLNSLEEV